MAYQTRTLYQSWCKPTDPTNPSFDRLDHPHPAMKDKIQSLIDRGELARYRTPADIDFEERPDGNVFRYVWSTQAIAQEWLDLEAQHPGYISGEIIEI